MACEYGQPCEEYGGLVLTGRLWELHSGIGADGKAIDPALCESYRQAWRQRGNVAPVQTIAVKNKGCGCGQKLTPR